MAVATQETPIERSHVLRSGTDPALTLGALWWGPADAQMQLAPGRAARAMRLASGASSVEMTWRGTTVAARAWGPGAQEALDLVPALVGELDDPAPLVAHHPVVAELMRRFDGLRLTRGTAVIDVLVSSIIGQKVTAFEARRTRRL